MSVDSDSTMYCMYGFLYNARRITYSADVTVVTEHRSVKQLDLKKAYSFSGALHEGLMKLTQLNRPVFLYITC